MSEEQKTERVLHLVYAGRRTAKGGKLAHLWLRVEGGAVFEEERYLYAGKNIANAFVGQVYKVTLTEDNAAFSAGERAPSLTGTLAGDDPDLVRYLAEDRATWETYQMSRNAKKWAQDTDLRSRIALIRDAYQALPWTTRTAFLAYVIKEITRGG